MSDEKYLKSMLQNKQLSEDYYRKSINKTYQQIFLEEKIIPRIVSYNNAPKVIVDVACGGGTLTYHISKIFPNANYILTDINPEAINIAKEINKNLNNAKFLNENFLNTEINPNIADLVFCSQTLLAVSKPKKFLLKIIEITKKGGFFVVSSLFNTEYDTDIHCSIRDFSRKGRIKIKYNTFSKRTITSWLKGKVEFFEIIPFEIPEPLPKTTRGLGSHTLRLEDGRYITISGGVLMQWGFLVGRK